MPTHINTFSEGLDRDTSKNKYPNTKYYNAENLRVTSTDELSNGALVNVKGNSELFTFDSIYEIPVMIIEVKNDTIIFSYDSNTEDSNIYKVNTTTLLAGGVVLNSGELLYSDSTSTTKFNFKDGENFDYLVSYDTPESSVGSVITHSAIGKVYWIDGVHPLRMINIYQDNTYNDLTNKEAVEFDILNPVNFGNIEFKQYGSGQLTSGKYSYCYQLYKVGGQSTSYSSSSNPIPVFKSASSDLATLKGDKGDINTFKSIVLKIDVWSREFNRIKIAAIDYKTDVVSPTTRIIYDGDLSGTPFDSETPGFLFEIEDRGQTIDTVSLAELRILGEQNIKPKTIATKADRIIVGNLQDEIFDIEYDARAYRFGEAGYSKIMQTDGSYYLIYTTFDAGKTLGDWSYFNSSNVLQSSGTNWSIPATADCINPDNTSEVNNYTTQAYPSHTTIGGTGKNISYAINVEFDKADAGIEAKSFNAINSRITPQTGFESLITFNKLGFMPDEVYRFGIVIIDELGRKSPAKWIGDIKMPTIASKTLISSQTSGLDLETLFRKLTVSFTVSNLGGYDFFIVTSKREEKDNTVLSTGFFNMLNVDTSVHTLSPTLSTATTTASTTMTSFFSPELSYRTNITGDIYLKPHLKVSNFVEETLTVEDVKLHFKKAYVLLANANSDTYTGAIPTTKYIFIKNPPDGIDNTTKYDLCGDVFKPYVVNATYSTDNSKVGTHLLISTKDLSYDATKLAGCLGSIKRANPSLFNGQDYNSRSNTAYIQCSDIPDRENETRIITAYGDTFSYYYSVMTLLADLSIAGTTDKTAGMHVLFPVFSRINQYLSYGSLLYREVKATDLLRVRNDEAAKNQAETAKIVEKKEGYEGNWFQDIAYWVSSTVENIADNIRDEDNTKTITKTSNFALMQEYAGEHIYTRTSDDAQISYLQKDNMYEYNRMYSRENMGKVYFSNPVNYFAIDNITYRLRASEKKLKNYNADTWLVFKPNNFIDLDGQYGDLTRLVAKNTLLLAFQEKGISQVSVEERSMITDNNVGKLTLGTGDVLSRFDYITTTQGIKRFNDVINTPDSIYFFDTTKPALYAMTEKGGLNIMELKGLNSYLKNYIGIYNGDSYIEAFYDLFNREVVFTFKYSGTTIGTIGLDELTNNFTCFYSISPVRYFQVSSKILSFIMDISDPTLVYNSAVWIHDSGSRNTFYDTYYPSKLSIIVNPNDIITNIYNNMEFRTEVVGSTYQVGDVANCPEILHPGESIEFVANVPPYQAGEIYVNNTVATVGAQDLTVKTLLPIPVVTNILLNPSYAVKSYGDIYNKTITSITFNTDYQRNSAKSLIVAPIRITDPLTQLPIQRRFRVWRIQIPFNELSRTPLNFPDRFRDTYLKVDIEFNDPGYKFVLHDIATGYLPVQM